MTVARDERELVAALRATRRLAVIRGLDGFAGRSSLKTWIFAVATNTALSG